MVSGRVIRFDDRAGWGAVQDDDGRELFFHCTAVADGSRNIAEGTAVDFDVVPGHRGRWEAWALQPRP